MTEPAADYMQTYDSHWKSIVENPDGSLNKDQVARELADALTLQGHLSEVYLAVSRELVSKPFTLPSVVIEMLDERLAEAAGAAIDDLFGQIIDAARGPFTSTDEVVALIRELAGLPMPDEVIVDGFCPSVLCLITEPHAHPVCQDCGAVRYGNMCCQTCVSVRGGDLNPHRLLDPDEIVFPLTCEWCKRNPADHLLIWDYRPRGCPAGVTDRLKTCICGPCAHSDTGRAQESAASPSSTWLYSLSTELKETCHV